MSARTVPLRGERGRFVPAEAPLETPRNRRRASRKHTPARSGGEQMFDADADAGAMREEMTDAPEPPGHMSGSNSPPLPPPSNNLNLLQDCINALWAIMVML
ncbi:hypothetical protein BKA63DRAFT_429358 [Paraphoma chrysanthemicola]|nr:hypothetical protein BKA63DRAFT_429358 [Paraphoma chrysanthemicola]